ncbi:amino acid permease [Acidianus sulfidivorans JP7]|uniref:Amino acid permease n=1 Tax=Acidianus sulfidivorans JP7 TaxID=619593 RepID=A0A2U9IPS6_9CREN|nr:APC family permease [Acidianus sulfidivorans]AWR98012.1 amino acid permease [Acidianus sulfidivorans JP7]
MSSKIFVRESSGLKKEVSLLDAIMLNLANMPAGVALFNSISPYIYPGTLIWLAAIIGLILAVPQMLVYTYLGSKISRTGGDYVWISRILNGGLGSVMAFALMIESTAFFALTAFFFSSTVSTVFSTIGSLDGISSLVTFSNTLSSPIYSYALGAGLFTFIVLINILKSKWGFSLVSISGIIALISTAIAMILIGINLHDFHSAISHFLTVENIAPPTHYSTASFSIYATLGSLPLLAIFTYPWIQAVPAVGSELKKPAYLKYGIFIPVLSTAFIVTLGFLLLYLGGGYSFTNYEFINNGFVYTFWTVAMALTSNEILQWIIGIGLMFWEFSVLAYGVILFARYIFAMAFDRVFPEIFTRLNRAGSPVYTHVFDLALTLTFLTLPVISISGATSLYGATVIGPIYFFTVSIAGLFYGYKSDDAKLRKAIIPVSVISAGYFVFLTYEAIVNPAFDFTYPNGQPDPITLAFVIGSFLVGSIIYLVARSINKKKGLELDLAFKEIPPD